MFENGYKNISSNNCSIKTFKGKQNTLCINIGSYIGYYNIKNNQMSIIYNIDINKLSYYNPYHYNPNNIKNILVIGGILCLSSKKPIKKKLLEIKVSPRNSLIKRLLFRYSI